MGGDYGQNRGEIEGKIAQEFGGSNVELIPPDQSGEGTVAHDPRFRKTFPAPHPSSLRPLPQHSGKRQHGFSLASHKKLEWCGMLWSVLEVSTVESLL